MSPRCAPDGPNSVPILAILAPSCPSFAPSWPCFLSIWFLLGHLCFFLLHLGPILVQFGSISVWYTTTINTHIVYMYIYMCTIKGANMHSILMLGENATSYLLPVPSSLRPHNVGVVGLGILRTWWSSYQKTIVILCIWWLSSQKAIVMQGIWWWSYKNRYSLLDF